MLPINGYLRDSVSINWLPSSVELIYSVWSIELPLRHFIPSKKLSAFFRREIPSSELADEHEQIQNLISVLSHQGCLIPEKAKKHYSLQEVKALYISFCNEFYGRYYAHPLWEVMRDDNIPNSVIRQWISRTYFLSRFAGVTAATASRNGPTTEVRSAFLKSAIEEYSHCEDYYLPPKALYPAELGYTSGIAPAASFIAFDQQMLHIAQQDWLAHLFVALIQERTAQFKEVANQLYERVEQQLDMPALFDGWRTHISFDEDNAHANDLDELFDQKLRIPVDRLQKSFDEASLTVELLTDGLDEVRRLGERSINPRANTSSLAVRPHHIQGIKCLSGISEYTFKAGSLNELTLELTALIAKTPQGATFLSNAADFLFSEIETSITEHLTACIEHCNTHSAIIYLGNVLAAASKSNLKPATKAIQMRKAGRIIRNYLSNQARNPTQFAFTLLLCLRLIDAGLSIATRSNNLSRLHSLTRMLEIAVVELGKEQAVVPGLNDALFTLTLIELAYEKRTAECPVFPLAKEYRHQGAVH
ncbi:hypothetical protein ACUHMQ_17295 [Chitinimonas sp. PSY-7]|uniref:hypothetical protein n=1 Tax=Chitinimonas sp. PSY-7 TaxID=3459088 RepID=UPI0040402561